jgi:CBS domain-containing protein
MNDKQKSSDRESGFHDRVADLMTEAVVTTSPGETLASAAQRMLDSDCGSLPVIDSDGRAVGVITDRDIAMFIAPRGLDATTVQVRECMSEDLVTCDMGDPVDRCLQRMADNQVRRIPVVDKRGYLVGILTQADLARHADAHRGNGERRSVASLVSAISEPCAT